MELRTMIAAAASAHRNIPFALYAFPGETDYRFIASRPDGAGENELPDPDPSRRWVEISLFNGENEYPIGIKDELTENDIISGDVGKYEHFPEAEIRPVCRSTGYPLYLAQHYEYQKSLKGDGSKAVLSRIISARAEGLSPLSAAKRYFEQLPDTFRCVYFTQETGIWMTATPELLLDYDYADGRFTTMSLAGTRPVSGGGDWDEKNSREQDIVTQYIIDTLQSLGAEDVAIAAPAERRFGDIEHRCTIITGRYTGDPRSLLAELSPTPAVAGFPRDKALDTIARFEAHPRHCYAGYIAVNDPETRRLRAYVNLRCAFMMLDGDYLVSNIYAGGGITRKSAAESEWIETELKAKPLIEILSPAPAGEGDDATEE